MRRPICFAFLSILLLGASLFGGVARAEPREPKTAPHIRMTWQQRFAAANTTHDGQLTREQALLGYPSVSRWFDAIDIDGKGFVTMSDITAWHKATRIANRGLREQRDERPRPRPAVQPVVTPPDTAANKPQATAQAKPLGVDQ